MSPAQEAWQSGLMQRSLKPKGYGPEKLPRGFVSRASAKHTREFGAAQAPCGKVYCADGHEEAVLIARVALEGEKKDD